jgi:hypothetical protein
MTSFVLALLATTTNAATALVPLEAMTATDSALVQPVIEHYTFSREYPIRTFRGRTAQFEALMDDIAACSVLSQTLGLTMYRVVTDSSGNAVADNREGARGYLRQVYCAEGRRGYYVEGAQRGVFQTSGSAVVIVQFTQTAPETIEYSGTMFVKIDNPVVATLAQVFFIFVKNAIDHHFNHLMNQPVGLCGMAVDDPAVLSQCIEQMPPGDYWMLAPFAATLRASGNAAAQ